RKAKFMPPKPAAANANANDAQGAAPGAAGPAPAAVPVAVPVPVPGAGAIAQADAPGDDTGVTPGQTDRSRSRRWWPSFGRRESARSSVWCGHLQWFANA